MHPNQPQSDSDKVEHEANAGYVESPAELARRSLPANLLAAAVAGVLTLWMGDSMPNWPRNNTLALVYVLMLPFLMIFPLVGLANLGWAGKILLARVTPAGPAQWGFFIAALLINLFALPAFALGVRTLLAF
jgi:hypothetical protein